MKYLSLLALLFVFFGCSSPKEEYDEDKQEAQEEYDESMKQAEEDYKEKGKEEAEDIVEDADSVKVEDDEETIKVDD